MKNQRKHLEDFICEKNCAVPDIIPFNTKDNDARNPTRSPVSDEESSADSLLGHTPTELEGGFFSDNSDAGSPDSLSPVSNIPSPSQTSPPNTSQEGDISREVAQAEPKHKYQRK